MTLPHLLQKKIADKYALGFGSPLIDHLAEVHEAQLQNFGLLKGGMKLVEGHEVLSIRKQIPSLKTATGGSASNTMLAMARLGARTGFSGKIAADEWGTFFRDQLSSHGVKNELIHAEPGHHTGQVVSLITPDGERSFATHLGAALLFKPEDLRPAMFDGADLVYVEGYLVMNRPLIEAIFKLAHQFHVEVAIDLASYNVVEENKEAFLKYLKDDVDIVFANEEEAMALTGKKDTAALEELKKMCKVAVVKLGDKGSLAGNEKNDIFHPIEAVKALDTTGAGDLYAAGFLYGHLLELPLATCAALGSLVSHEVVQVVGASLENKTWDKIKTGALGIISSPAK